VALASDNFIAYSTWKWIEMHTATGKAPVHRYLFDHIIPTATGNPPADDPGAAHATDIEFVFSTLETKKLAWRGCGSQGGRHHDVILDELCEDRRPERAWTCALAAVRREEQADSAARRKSEGRGGDQPRPLRIAGCHDCQTAKELSISCEGPMIRPAAGFRYPELSQGARNIADTECASFGDREID
jgi:hypothetical protein